MEIRILVMLKIFMAALKLFTATRFGPFANGAYDFQRMALTKG
jgi:hypothetical protein